MKSLSEIYKAITKRNPSFHIIISFKYQYGNAFTFYCFILTKDKTNIPILCHELVHVEHYYKHPFTFLFSYCYQIYKVGYRNTIYYKEAEEVEQQARTLRSNP